MSREERGAVGVSQPSVLVVTLNWNGWKATLNSVESVLRLNYWNLRVLMIDNGSADGSVEHLRSFCGDRVDLLELPENRGYTGGCNEGFKHALAAGVDYVWLLNNDSEVVDKDTLQSLVALAESDPKIGLATPRIAVPGVEKRLTYCGGVCSVNPVIYDETCDPEEARRWAEKYPNAGLALGTAMLVKTSLIRKIGMLDERFFAYFEDIDYSLRSSQAGFRNIVDENHIVRHEEKNRNNNPLEMKPHYWYYWARNEYWFWRKHLGPIGALRRSWWAFDRMMRNLRACRENQDACNAILAGTWHGWINKKGAYRSEFRMPRLLAAVVWRYAMARGEK
ncbi:MAG: glycosyltransferase family 2 protein [Terracidiphilus sp.]